MEGKTLPSLPYTLDFESGALIAVEASPRFGYAFKNWSGDLTGNTNPAAVLMECERKITATFAPDWVLIGTSAGCLALVIFLVTVLIIRRKA
ncbi:hypothetical protein ACFLUG_04120 [Chloroflexota bacterium]